MATRLKLRLNGTKEEALQAIVQGLPKDTIVRDEDDGIGRFAGERTVVIVGIGKDRLMVFSGTYGAIKGRMDTPHLDVVFESSKDGLLARLTREADKPLSLFSRVADLVGYMVTVAAVIVAYHLFRSLEIDMPQTAIVSVGGGVAWAAIVHYLPKRQDVGLQELVTKALKPMTIKPSKPNDAEGKPHDAVDAVATGGTKPADATAAPQDAGD